MKGGSKTLCRMKKLNVVQELIANKITNTNINLIMHRSQLKKLFNVALAWQMSKILKRI
jgi:hypothetical protein